MKLRVWPGIVAGVLVVVGLVVGLLFNLTMPDAASVGMGAALVGAVAIFLWWLFFSRVRWVERVGALAVLIAAWVAMRPFLDRSIIGGAMGALPVFAFTVLAVALVVWASLTRDRTAGMRYASLVVAMVIACGLCTLVKTAGLRGGFFEFHWRWTPTPEERLLVQGNDDPAPTPPAPATETPREPPAATANGHAVAAPPPFPVARKPAEWPGFRGPRRDGIVHTVRIDTDWSKSPPVELWRRPIGPGWSSFAVDGDVIYTQEQRGNDEIVASYS